MQTNVSKFSQFSFIHNNSLVVAHIAGFFSTCSVILSELVVYFNTFKKTPDYLNTNNCFQWYKNNINNYFQKNDLREIKYYNVNYHHDNQFIDYNNVNIKEIKPFIEKYFTTNADIIDIIKLMEKKYNIQYENTCVIFYRGNDKNKEVKISSYIEYINKAKEILLKNPNIKFLIQSDETEFIETIIKTFPTNHFYFKDESRHIKKGNSSVDKISTQLNKYYSKYFLAIVIIMSKCHTILFGTGNISIWILFYRQNSKNVFQYLDNKCIELLSIP